MSRAARFWWALRGRLPPIATRNCRWKGATSETTNKDAVFHLWQNHLAATAGSSLGTRTPFREACRNCPNPPHNRTQGGGLRKTLVADSDEMAAPVGGRITLGRTTATGPAWGRAGAAARLARLWGPGKAVGSPGGGRASRGLAHTGHFRVNIHTKNSGTLPSDPPPGKVLSAMRLRYPVRRHREDID